MRAGIVTRADRVVPAWLQPVTVLDLMAARDCRLESALRHASLFPARAPLTETRISAALFERLLANAESAWPGHDFTFQLGSQLALSGLGPLQRYLQTLPTLRAVLDALAEFRLLAAPTLRLTVVGAVDRSVFLLFSGATRLRAPTAWAEIAMTTVTRLAAGLTRERIAADCFFRREPPRRIEQFEAHLPGRLCFDAPFDGIRFGAPGAALRPAAAGAHGMQVAEAQCREATGDCRYLLDALCELGLDRSGPPPTLTAAAGRLETSPATLKRKLGDHGASFRALLDAARRERAIVGLLLENASVEEIAERLRFRDTSNFRRAFKRWTGMTPSRLRDHYRTLAILGR